MVVVWCRVGGTECSSNAWDLWKEVTIIFTTSTIVWAERNYPTSKERRLHRHRTAESYSTFKVRRGGREEIPHVRGKRNPSEKLGVGRGHQMTDTLKP